MTLNTTSLWCVCVASLGALLFAPLQAHCAPVPGTASSKLISSGLGLFRSAEGFQLNAGNSGWIHAEVPRDNRTISTIYRAPVTLQKSSTDRVAIEAALKNGELTPEGAASLTVRVDQLERDQPVERYVQRWMKEYPKYGFDVIGSKPFSQNKMRGYVLDLLNRDARKQVRQVVFLKKQKAVILTCRDNVATFRGSLKGCNEIIRTFTWTE